MSCALRLPGIETIHANCEGNCKLNHRNISLPLALSALLALPCLAHAQTYEGRIVDGGGIDDMQITVRVSSSRSISAYCNRQCGDWFVEDDDAISRLRESMAGRKVRVVVKREASAGRIAGPSDDEEFLFIKRLELLRE